MLQELFKILLTSKTRDSVSIDLTIGPLQDPVTWYWINYTGTQITQWDFQNKEKSGWTGKNSFVLEVPLRYLRPSVIYSVPCDRNSVFGPIFIFCRIELIFGRLTCFDVESIVP